MKYNIIVAYDNYCGIGKDNTLPWPCLKSDMLRFRDITTGNGKNCVVMGRKTFESIPNAPLKGRYNYVFSREYMSNVDKVGHVRSFDEIPDKYETVWIIGGESIYRKALEELCISSIYVTEIKADFQCDRFFPFEHVTSDRYDKVLLDEKEENGLKLLFFEYKNRDSVPN